MKFETSVAGDENTEALRLFDKATEKEQHGLMSEAVSYYRQAFKLNSQIDKVYREHKLPSAHAKLAQSHGKNFGRTVDKVKLQAIDVEKLLQSFASETPRAPDPSNPDHYDDDHVAIKFANLGIDNHESYVDLAPVSILTKLPQELWIRILVLLLEIDPHAWFNFGITCKKHAYYAFGTSQVWKRMCYMVYPYQSYRENNTGNNVNNMVNMVNTVTFNKPLSAPIDPELLLLQYGGSWKEMIRKRPYIKFLGCYISVVNYYSEGGRSELSTNWNNPVRTITYYRYLRFYPHGECIMALTRLEPNKVVPQFLKHNELQRLLRNTENRDPQNINIAEEPHKIFHGKWSIAGGDTVHIEINNGSVSYYDFHYYFHIRNLGGAPNHSKLSWISFNATWKSVPGHEDRQDEIVDFSLKNEKDFKFLRVKLYTVDN